MKPVDCRQNAFFDEKTKWQVCQTLFLYIFFKMYDMMSDHEAYLLSSR